jgi:hypothetical protein
VVHPDYLLGAAGVAAVDGYGTRRRARENKTYRYQQNVMSGKHTLVQVKEHAPYTNEQTQSVYLDPTARAAYDEAEGSWTFGGERPGATRPSRLSRAAAHSAKPGAHHGRAAAATPAAPLAKPGGVDESPRLKLPKSDSKTALSTTMAQVAEGLRGATDRGVGVDIESTVRGRPSTWSPLIIDHHCSPHDVLWTVARGA